MRGGSNMADIREFYYTKKIAIYKVHDIAKPASKVQKIAKNMEPM